MGSTVTLIILSLPIHEHGMSYHLLRSSLISFSNALWVLVFKSFNSSVKFIEIVFLRTFSDYSQWGMEMQPFFKLFFKQPFWLFNLLVFCSCSFIDSLFYDWEVILTFTAPCLAFKTLPLVSTMLL